MGRQKPCTVAMEDAMAQAPEAGAVIRGTNGLRKVGFGYGGRGKSGGGRTIYYVMLDDEVVYLLVAYAKADKEGLTAGLFSTLIEELPMTERTELGLQIEAGLREAIAHRKGKVALESRHVEAMPAARVREIRSSLAKSTKDFERRFGIPARTVEGWEVVSHGVV